MDKAVKLTTGEILNRLNLMHGWRFETGAIARDFVFRDFVAAFEFMTKVARIAEEMNHHPCWTNVYNKLNVRLNTHDVDGISEKDFALAERMNAVFDGFKWTTSLNL